MSLHCPPRPSRLEVGPTVRSVAAARQQVQTLLATVAGLDLDADAWGVVTADAVVATRALAGSGALPDHLVVAADDPPVAVRRLLVAASNRSADLYAGSQTGRRAWEMSTTVDA